MCSIQEHLEDMMVKYSRQTGKKNVPGVSLGVKDELRTTSHFGFQEINANHFATGQCEQVQNFPTFGFSGYTFSCLLRRTDFHFFFGQTRVSLILSMYCEKEKSLFLCFETKQAKNNSFVPVFSFGG